MTVLEQNIDLKNLDKSNWKPYRFEEIAKKVTETVDPNTTELEIYIGLEHIDANDLHIRRNGVPSDVKGGKLKCYPGDIIFGKRRAYQRKAAIVDFEGICSAHAFVFRANPEIIDPKLFPFFLHSDEFMHRMVDISVGGLSPTINWGDLKHQEFLLPPKDQQAQLAELLWAMDEVIEREKEVLERTNLIRQVTSESLLNGSKRLKSYREDWKPCKLGDVAEIKRGLASQHLDYVNEENGVRLLRINDFFSDNRKYILESEATKKLTVRQNDILIAGTGHTAGISAFIDSNWAGLPFSYNAPRIRMNDKVDARYIFHVLNSSSIKNQQNRLFTGNAQPFLDIKAIAGFKISLPTYKEQQTISNRIDFIEGNLRTINVNISSSQTLQKSLINQVF